MSYFARNVKKEEKLIKMITHLFYHQERVELNCALNSWLSIRNFFLENDEVIILDLGNTLPNLLPFKNYPKFIRFEKIRTDLPQERSYTYGLNEIIPKARNEWVVLWRSDYIYHKKYIKALREGMKHANAVMPYEGYIGAYYSNYRWCRRNLKKLMNSDIEFILRHSHVCPIYELTDFAYFAIKKQLWINVGGMNEKLWGYGYQFPELFYRLMKRKDYNPSIEYDMIAFHQDHAGSFSLGALDKEKKKELADAKKKSSDAFGGEDNFNKFKEGIRREPLRARWPDEYYIPTLPKYNLRNIFYKQIEKGFRLIRKIF